MSDLQEFIDRCNKPEFQETVEKHYKEADSRKNKWLKNNPEKRKECINRYAKTEKGIFATSKSRANRRIRDKEASKMLSKEEKQAIAQFYINCPEDHEVDHIIPLSRGGSHCLSNLQYLTTQENRMKKDKTPEEYEEYKEKVFGSRIFELSE